MPDFEYDPNKSEANVLKHGIDFHQAQALWNDPGLIQIQSKSDDEERYLVVGQIDGRHWSAVITYREQIIRIISVRRSRKAEVTLYESN